MPLLTVEDFGQRRLGEVMITDLEAHSVQRHERDAYLRLLVAGRVQKLVEQATDAEKAPAALRFRRALRGKE